MSLAAVRTQATTQVQQVATRAKKNLLPPFSAWTKPAAGTGTDYVLTLDANADYLQSSSLVIINGPITLTYSFEKDRTTCFGNIRWYDAAGTATMLLDSIGVGQTGRISGTVNVPANAVQVRASLLNANGTGARGIYTFTNPQLELGSAATPFEPYVTVPDLKPRVQLLAAVR